MLVKPPNAALSKSWPRLRNLAVGLYELEKERGRTPVNQFKSWCRQMTPVASPGKLILRD